MEEIIFENDTDAENDLTDDDEDWVIDENFPPLLQKPRFDDLLESKKQVIYYVVKVVEEERENEYSVSFLKLIREQSFIFPLEPNRNCEFI